MLSIWLTMTSLEYGIHLIFGLGNTNTFKKLESELVVWNPFMAMNTNTFHFWLRNTNTFTPWEKSIWAQSMFTKSNVVIKVTAKMVPQYFNMTGSFDRIIIQIGLSLDF